MWTDLPTVALICGFLVAALVIFFSGLRMTSVADRLADRTGLGEAIVGGVLLGAATSLSGIIVSITAALDGRASLAFSNAVGGIAAQTVFLAVADMFYRRINLEHAAADLANVLQGLVLMVLLTIPFLAMTSPDVTIWAIHPLSLVIPLVYAGGLVASRSARETPMWKPVETSDTDEDTPDEEDAESAATSTARLAAIFGGLMLLMGTSGWVIAKTSSVLSDRMELSETLVGVLATAVVTSLPELVTTVAAVRRGALQLAVGGIIGGNTFDTLFLMASDVAYRDGSLYHAAGMGDFFWIATALLMTSVLLGGLILRQRQGPGKIGGESLLILLIYAGAVLTQIFI
ncbi:cation:H+ antiporter [Palleronia marisminoris]|uniref:Inner membrane protein YrbG n=1 Tax=Palleronia marisminoris TaxID=315423 RepID=A0A1Y5RZJ8_9RHOB|nr:sodium:calcium antiporter [Palleronia marisminoris]SFG45050.1 cation:H+ antiporter [Palleronia marisminoris]SLN26206.1 Inner membrane protein YrbG [Palleronia marisminoris]